MIAFLLFAAEEGEGVTTLIRQEIAAVILLAIAAGVAVLSRLANFPFTVALVIAGGFAALLGDVVAVDVNSELILALLVPPLLFEATLHLPWAKLKADLVDVLSIALIGTTLGTFLVGWVMHTVLDIPWALAFAFGALISATDPVAVVAFFKTLGVPKRLGILVEGESLFNDAIAVVAFTIAISVAEGSEQFSVGDAIGDFIIVSAGGLAVGLLLGWVVSNVILAGLDDPLVETTTTLALAYGSFLMAEEFGLIIGQEGLHFSGILAVVAAGLMVGNVGFKNTSPSTRLTLDHFWELLTFLVNSIVFLFIGITIGLQELLDNIDAVALAIVTVLVVRVLVIYGLSGTTNTLFPSRKIPRSYQHVMYWGGLRGAISLALALTIQDNEELREVAGAENVRTVVVMAFGVVLFTLLIQGLTISGLIQRLGLAGRATNELEQQEFQARVHMQRAGQDAVNRLGSEGVVFDDMAEALAATYQRTINNQTGELSDHVRLHPELESAMLIRARRDALVSEQSALTEVTRTGLVDTEVAEHLSIELNNRIAALDVLKLRWETDEQPHDSDGDDNE